MITTPIIFSSPMIKALLAGRKTQTRRLAYDKRGKPTAWLRMWERFQAAGPGYTELVWVRENIEASGALVQYVADRSTSRLIRPAEWRAGSRPSIHMPRWASRITLTVLAVKRERLQDISEEDARAEGISPLPLQDAADPSAWWESAPGENQARSASDSFAKLWNSLHGPEAWSANPELVVLSFSVEQRNIDRGAA